MGLLKEVISLQRGISYNRKYINVFGRVLNDQIRKEEDPTYVGKIHECRESIIEQSSRIKEFLGFRELTILKKKSEEYRKLIAEYYTLGKGYTTKSFENAQTGGEIVGTEYNFEKPIKMDLIEVGTPVFVTGAYCAKLSQAYLSCSEKSKDNFFDVEKRITKITRVR